MRMSVPISTIMLKPDDKKGPEPLGSTSGYAKQPLTGSANKVPWKMTSKEPPCLHSPPRAPTCSIR
jgi:hypothetical protein